MQRNFLRASQRAPPSGWATHKPPEPGDKKEQGPAFLGPPTPGSCTERGRSHLLTYLCRQALSLFLLNVFLVCPSFCSVSAPDLAQVLSLLEHLSGLLLVSVIPPSHWFCILAQGAPSESPHLALPLLCCNRFAGAVTRRTDSSPGTQGTVSFPAANSIIINTSHSTCNNIK